MLSLGKKVKNQWQLSLLFVLFMPLLLRLGFWQLERATEKQQLLVVYQQQRELPVQKFDRLPPSTSTNYQTVEVEGKYNKEQYWLLDNKPRNGKVGYEIVMPLLVDQQWVLVNRGWILASQLRSELPEFDTPEGMLKIQGYFYEPSKNAVLKNKESDWSQAWPKRVLQLDGTHVAEALQKDTYPRMLRIEDESPGALITQWPVVNTLPEKHQGYAVQWFAMAFALLCLYVWALIKKENS